MTVVILSEAKNLIISTDSTIEILRLSSQNDIKRLSQEEEGSGSYPLSIVLLLEDAPFFSR